MLAALDPVQSRTEVMRQPIAVADLLKLFGGAPDEPCRDTEAWKLIGYRQRIVHVECSYLANEGNSAAMRGVVQPVGSKRLPCVLPRRVPLQQKEPEHLAKDGIGEAANRRAERASP